MPEISDDWLITDTTDDRLMIANTRTQHGFLVLIVQIFIQGQTIRIRH